MQTIKHMNLDERVTHRSLERGLRILEAVASSDGTTTLAEMVRRTGLHRSTAHHLLKTLVDLDYLHQDPGTRRYELSAKLFRLTRRTWTADQLGEIAEPFLAGLTERIGEGSSFAAYRDGVITIVAKREPDGPVRVVQNLGSLRPIHASAVGKAIVAWLPEAERAGVIRRCRLERYTANTIRTRSRLEAELQRVRTAGYAIDDEEHLDGIRCLGAPVFGFSGQVLGSLCTVGPRSRLSHQRLRQLRAVVIDVARAVSERLGWQRESVRVTKKAA